MKKNNILNAKNKNVVAFFRSAKYKNNLTIQDIKRFFFLDLELYKKEKIAEPLKGEILTFLNQYNYVGYKFKYSNDQIIKMLEQQNN